MTDNANSAPFRQMADNIDHNKDATFGGACVIVPPANGGDVISTLILDTTGDAVLFWTSVQARATQMINELGAKQATQQAFPRRGY